MALIYIVEDDINIREIEAFSLKNSGYKIKDFGCAADFFAKMQEKLPNLIILDVMLPDEDGLSIVKKLRSNPESRKIPVIMVTAKTTELDKVKGLDMGADDYLTKPFGVMELISRVKALLRRCEGMEDEKFYSVGGLFLDIEKHSVSVNEEPVELTYKEYELLRLLIQNAGIVTSRDTIMERVWGTDFEGESRTLDMHIKSLRKKLGDSASMIRTMRGVGYIAEEPAETLSKE